MSAHIPAVGRSSHHQNHPGTSNGEADGQAHKEPPAPLAPRLGKPPRLESEQEFDERLDSVAKETNESSTSEFKIEIPIPSDSLKEMLTVSMLGRVRVWG